MKKIIVILAAMTFAMGCLFAQDAATTTTTTDNKELRAELTNAATPDISTRVIEVEDKYADVHPKAMSVKLQMEYTPLTGDVNFYYTCMAASFDQGEAMNTAIEVLKEFQDENQYLRYTYKSKDKVRYFKDGRDVKMAEYRAMVTFTR
jgi:hypothetical protein